MMRDIQNLLLNMKEKLAYAVAEADRLSQSSLYASQALVQSVYALRAKITSDKVFLDLYQFSQQPGMEALANELVIRAKSKAIQYSKELDSVLKAFRDAKANAVLARNPSRGMLGFSLSDIFTSSDSPAGDRDSGLRILRAYFDTSRNYPTFIFADFNSFISSLEQKTGYDFPSHVGELVRMNYASTTESEAARRVSALADSTQGQASASQMIASAGGKGDTINLSAAIPEVASATGAELVSMTQDIGAGLTGTIKALKYLPWILGVGAVIYIVFIAKKHGEVLDKVMRNRA
jgi:hypothetical protein